MWVMFRLKDNVDAILEFSIRPIYPTWVLILIPVMCGVARFRGMPHKSSMGIIFNTRDMRGVSCWGRGSISNDVGIIFNTRDVSDVSLKR